MSETLVHVPIQTAITFEILKSYRGFCILLPIKDYTLRLCRLEVSARSQVFKIRFPAIVRWRLIVFSNMLDFVLPLKLRQNLLVS